MATDGGHGGVAGRPPDDLTEDERVQRTLTAHTLFFDILSEGDTEARGLKMRRVASDQRLKDMDSAPSVPSELGSSTMNGDAAASSCPNLDSMPGARGSPSNLGAGAHSNAPLDASVFDDVSADSPDLKDEDTSRLLRTLCGDMFIEASRLEGFEPLGQGAFATVKKCRLKPPEPPDGNSMLRKSSSFRHSSLHKNLVAVKQLKPSVLNNETELHGFIAETDVLRKLRHPAIVEFKGVGAMNAGSAEEMRRSMFLVQELMAGGTLKALLVDAYFAPPAQRRLFSRQDAMRWVLQIAEALAYLHHFSPLVVHRDLKLENILLTSPNPAIADAKLADFGLHKCIKDVASGVPMAQSTEQLQSLLKDMGFTGPPPRDSCATDPSASQGGAQQGTSAAAAEHASAVRAHEATLDMLSAMDTSGSSAHDALRQTLLQQQQRQQEQPLLPLGRSSSGYVPSPSPEQPYKPTALQRKSQTHQPSTSGSQHQSQSSPQQEQQQQEADASVEHAILVAAAAAGRERNRAAQEFRRQSDHEQQAPAVSSLPYSIPEGRNEGGRSEAGSCSEHSNHLQRGSGSASGPRDWSREATSTSRNATLDPWAELPPGNAIRERPRTYANRSAPGSLRASDAHPSEWQQLLQGSGCVHEQHHPSAASIAAGGGLPTLPRAPGKQLIGSTDSASGQRQWRQARPSSERLPPPNQESPFADLHPLPGRYIPALRELPSDSQGLERLSLGQQEVAEETVTRRSNSGPLSATMLRSMNAVIKTAPPCLSTKSMGMLGAEVGGSAAQLPPLPRGSGVAQRLRGIRAVSREGGSPVLDECDPEAALLNAEVAAKLRYSRAGGGDGLADQSPPGSWCQDPPGSAGSPSAHAGLAGLFSRMGHGKSRISRRGSAASTRRNSAEDSPSGPPLSRMSDVSHTGRSHTGDDAYQNGPTTAARTSSAYLGMNGFGTSTGPRGGTVVSGGGAGGSMGAAAPPPPKPGLFKTFSGGGGAAAAAAGMRRNSTLKAQLSRVSCGLGSDSGGSACMDGSIHAANMVYRMTGTTGSLAYMAPEVLRGVLYNEKVDVFSLAVVMYELCSYTPTVALVTGEDMVDRMYEYAEKVAGGFRQGMPDDWPQEVRDLISECWAANPIARPSAAKIARRLRVMRDTGVLKQWDEADAKAGRAGTEKRSVLLCCAPCLAPPRTL